MASIRERFAEVRRTLPRAYWIVWVGTLINRAGGFVVPLLTFYLTDERGLSLGDAGLIISLFGAGSVVAALVGGVLADRMGRRATMSISLLGGAVVMAALGLARDPWMIGGLTLLLGFVGELYRPAVSAFVADVVPPEHRLRAYGLLYWAINIGFSIAPLVAGLLAGWSYTAIFVVDAVTMAIYGLFVLLRLPETRPIHPTDAAAPRTRLVEILSDRTFLVFWLLAFLVALIIFQHNVSLPGFMKAQGHDARTFGAVIAFNGIAIVLLQPWLTELVRRRDPSRVLALAALLTGAGFALHGVSPLVAVHIAAVLVWTLGEIVTSPISGATVAALAPADARGRYQGVYTMAWGLASFLGPLLGAQVLSAGEPSLLWGGCLVLGAIAAAGLLLTAAARRARMSQQRRDGSA